jgi:PAS domain S-box-containing protein
MTAGTDSSPSASDPGTIRVLQIAIEALPAASLLVDPAGAIAFVNRDAEHLFGCARPQLIGESVERVLPDTRSPVRATPPQGDAVALPAAPATKGIRTSAVRQDGSRVDVELRREPIADHTFTLIMVFELDARTGRPIVLDRPPAFESLAAELAARFAELRDNHLFGAIESGLDRLCEQLTADGATFYRLMPDGLHIQVAGPSVGPPQLIELTHLEPSRFPWTCARVLAGDVSTFAVLEDIPNPIDRRSYWAAGVSAAAVVPLATAGKTSGAVTFMLTGRSREWSAEDLRRLGIIRDVFEPLLAHGYRDHALRCAIADLNRFRGDLKAAPAAARKPPRPAAGRHGGGYESAAARRVMELIEQVAPTDSTVLLLGETGTGKERLASHIHERSARSQRPMIRVNCAAIPSTLIESELFGREKGAFTGALARQAGRFELADKGTIFLDEIGDLPVDVQVKLLRVLEERQIERLGSPRSITIDTRIIAATHQDLQQRINDGAFREDLYYRLNVFPIRVPSLRERVEDIPELVWEFVAEFSKAFGRRIETINPDSLAALQECSWPGNIRELRNTVERAMIVSTGTCLSIAPPPPSTSAARRSMKLIDVEKQHLLAVLESTHWRIRGESGAAARLGLKPTTLETRMARLGLKRPGR